MPFCEAKKFSSLVIFYRLGFEIYDEVRTEIEFLVCNASEVKSRVCGFGVCCLGEVKKGIRQPILS